MDQDDDASRRAAFSSTFRRAEDRPLSAAVAVEFGASSRMPPGRLANEDHYVILELAREQRVVASTLAEAELPGDFREQGYAMVVADGGGQSGSGTVASRVAIATLAHVAIHYGNWNLRIDPRVAEAVIQRVEQFYARSARAVDERRLSHPALATMHTTLTATFSAGDDLFVAHVGNSRAYLFREGELTQLTRDHTLDRRLSESRGPIAVPDSAHDLRVILTDALGAGHKSPVVDVEHIRLFDGDLLVLCTDGLTGALEDDTIAEVVAPSRNLHATCEQLLDMAAARGLEDDATVLLARYRIPPRTR
jgi:protein phosphatase